MNYIVSYQKHIDAVTTITLLLPNQSSRAAAGSSTGQSTELCTIDGVTYVSIPDDIVLPVQPQQIAASVQIVAMTGEIKDAIKDASSHVALITQRMIDMIRARYTIDDEMFFARIGIGAANGMYQPTADELGQVVAFGEFIEHARDWGRAQRAALGL